jgi:hypothetical protein
LPVGPKAKHNSPRVFLRVGEGALAPCPPSLKEKMNWWAGFALPTLHTVTIIRIETGEALYE